MTRFRYPNSDKTVNVGWVNGLWMFLFGVLYLVYKGLWRHALVFLAIQVIGVSSMDSPEEWVEMAWIPSLVYAFLVPGILKNHYREKGYGEVE